MATVLLEAPVSIEIVNQMRINIDEGHAEIDVRETAIGFVDATRSGTATDLETKFAVNVDQEAVSTEL